ncbi:hypothetical protein BRADI_3g37387v3 [Brachypodium distachyon]|uniref:Uncharacterized protein n=1 Tax=Brachypodium distachyon TaxID=15368 RepID=A0A2K2D1R3_BRADI|nr:hypothetical protein BRADI_3g37387v3 [Brachypodium distachyon]
MPPTAVSAARACCCTPSCRPCCCTLSHASLLLRASLPPSAWLLGGARGRARPRRRRSATRAARAERGVVGRRRAGQRGAAAGAPRGRGPGGAGRRRRRQGRRSAAAGAVGVCTALQQRAVTRGDRLASSASRQKAPGRTFTPYNFPLQKERNLMLHLFRTTSYTSKRRQRVPVRVCEGLHSSKSSNILHSVLKLKRESVRKSVYQYLFN